MEKLSNLHVVQSLGSTLEAFHSHRDSPFSRNDFSSLFAPHVKSPLASAGKRREAEFHVARGPSPEVSTESSSPSRQAGFLFGSWVTL